VSDFRPGLEGVVAFQTEIAEPDKEGGSLRYRGVDIEELVGHYPYEKVWGLLVDSSFEPGMPDPEPYRPANLTGNAPSDLQSALAHLSAEWGLQKLVDIEPGDARDDLARLSAITMSIVAQAARVADGKTDPIPDEVVEQGGIAAEKFLLRWRGEADPKHVQAIDTYWICTAEHGLNASTFTARIVASTGADAGAAMSAAVGALSGPLHGGAPARILPMLEGAEKLGDPERYVRELLDRGERLMGFGHRIYRGDDPRATLLKRTAQELGSARFEVADEVEKAALAELKRRKPDRPLPTNVEFWSAVVLDTAEVPPDLTPAMFGCARVAGWSAHILEERKTGRLIRPGAQYVGPAPRPASEVGAAPVPS
jgi:citrate synthase